MRFNQRVVYLCLLLSLIGLGAYAQGTTSTLVGTVTTGESPLPDATVTISSPALQGSRTTSSSETGAYVFPALPPGTYTVRIELQGMQAVTRKTTLQLAQTSRVDADLKVSAVSEAITVTAVSTAVLETPQIGTNVTSRQLDKLPAGRTITSAVSLSPGVTPGIAGLTISGAPSYDNLYLINGTVVNENLRGQPDNLFIDDAIQETTVLTGGITAEYGRFTGGVVSTITKSGGNEFNGSFRDTLSNSRWTAKTPWPGEADPISQINPVYEETLGGYLMKDRLWFFGAGRQRKSDLQQFTSVTNVPYTFGTDEKRLEGKLTAQIGAKHNVVGSYIDIKNHRTNDSQFTIMDLGSLFNRSLPNSLWAVQYNGILTNNLLLSGNYANKKFTFVGNGSPYTDLIKGTLMVDNPTGRRYWTSTFCGTCGDEDRNNFSWTGKANYFLSTKSFGSHNVTGGVQRYSETRLVNNHQSGSDFRILGNVTIVGTTVYPVLDSTSIIQWNPIFKLAHGTHLRTDSAFVNDKWDLNLHFSFNAGVRYDKNDGRDDDGHVVSNDSAFSPRLGAQYDINADGRHRVSLNFARYVSKIADGNVGGSANAAGSPSTITWLYNGPVINPAGTPDSQLVGTEAALTTLFDWFKSVGFTDNKDFISSGSISGLSTILPKPIVSPWVDEITVGYGVQIGHTAYARADYLTRNWKNFYAAELLVTNPRSLDQFGSGDVAYTINDNAGLSRKYRGLQMQGQWRPSNLSVGATYTYATLKGNDEGESASSATVRNTPLKLYYPEYLGYANRLPSGWLPEDVRHRARIWAGYDFNLGAPGILNVSILENFQTGSPYSVVSTIDATGRTPGTSYAGLPANPGYTLSQIGTSHTYFFGDRGALRTQNVSSTDLSLRYDFPFARASIFAQATVMNVLNENAVVNPDTTVYTRRTSSSRGLQPFNPFTDKPIECPASATAADCTAMGANYQKATTFGQAVGVSSYQMPRTYAFSAGVRF
jgi:hypothetical protein